MLRSGRSEQGRGLKISRSYDQGDRPRLLIIEQDRTVARRMVAALGGDGHAGPSGRRAADSEGSIGDPETSCLVIGSIRELFDLDLSSTEMVICAVQLPDGSGLNVLDYLRGRCPHIPVIMVGTLDESSVAVEAIRAGALDFLTSTGHDLRTLPLAVEKCLVHQRVKHENERLQRDLSNSLTELAVKNQQLQALVRQLETTARTDDLTGLCNRRSLNEMLRHEWQQAVRTDRPLAFMMIDLDDFKAINDQRGHQRGDAVLRETGRIIQTNCRQVDVAARYGGDEFCVLMPESGAHQTIAVANRILRENELANRRRPDGEPRVGMSIGVAQIDLSRPVNSEELIKHADEAMYAAKAAGKGRVMIRARDGVRTESELALDPNAHARG